MKILVACEFSGTVRDAFNAAGHDAMSCDILPTEAPGPHYQGDVMDLIKEPYDLVIAHPPCTYLSNSGVQHLYYDDDRWRLMWEATDFFAAMFTFNSPRICVENPVQHSYAVQGHGMGKPTQYVNPWQFGHPEMKKTGLWLVNLPKLTPTNNVYEHMMTLPRKQRQRLWWGSAGVKDRAHERSKTFPGIAQGMVDQWGNS